MGTRLRPVNLSGPIDRGGTAWAACGVVGGPIVTGGRLMAETEDHRAWHPPTMAETLRAPASPFALDTERRAALSLVLMNGFALGDLARLLDVFTSANELAQRRAFAWEIVAISGRSIASSAGIPVAADGDVTELRPLSTVIVFSDADASGDDCAGLAAWLSAHPASIQRLGGIGGGCSVLGRIAAMPKERARSAAQRKELFWRKDDFFGCRGGCATSDFALANVEAVLGAPVAQQVMMRLARQRDVVGLQTGVVPAVRDGVEVQREGVGSRE